MPKLPLVLACAAILPLSSCSNKKLEAKVKQLDEQIATLESDHESAIEEKNRDLAEAQNALDKAKEESAEKIAELTRERDNLKMEIELARNTVKRLQEASSAASGSTNQPAADPSKNPKYTNALVTIPCAKGKLRGLVANDSGKSYLYTTSAIFDAVMPPVATTTDGRRITRFGTMEILAGTDIVRLELPDAGDAAALTPATAATQPNADTKLAILSLDPATGAAEGILTQLQSQTPDSLQIDLSSLTGKAGAAVLDPATGQLLGIVTAAAAATTPTLWDEPVAGAAETPAAIRLNRTLNWQGSTAGAVLAERKRLAEYDQMTRLIHAFAAMKPSQEGLGVDASAGGGTATIKALLAVYKSNQVVADAIALHTQLAAKSGRIGETDLRKRIDSLYQGIASLAKRDAATFEPGKFSPTHRAAAERSATWRETAMENLKTAAAALPELNLKPAR